MAADVEEEEEEVRWESEVDEGALFMPSERGAGLLVENVSSRAWT